MATKKSQRIGIWIIAIVMVIGTIGSFAVMILGTQNNKAEQEKYQQAYEAYQKQLEEQEKLAKEMSAKYYGTLNEYKTLPTTFDAGSVTGDKVATNDLKQGDGAEIKEDTKYLAYYIGWNPSGKTFDSSFDGESLKAPLDTSESTLIKGWSQGVVGMKVGGVREITIPSKLAYGEAGSGDDIPANTPLKFIVMIIATK